MIPGYMENRHKELAELRELVGARNFQRIAEIAHRMVGVGSPYGFVYITEQARIMKKAAEARDYSALSQIVNDLGQYLRTVKIEPE